MTRRVLRGFLPQKYAQLRAQRGLTEAELARLSGVLEQSIRDWESGRTTPTLITARKTTRALKAGIPAFADVPRGRRMLSDLLNRKALTPPEFAKAVGISTTYYYEIETGKKKPPDPLVQTMAAKLGVSPNTVVAAWLRAKNRPPGTPA